MTTAIDEIHVRENKEKKKFVWWSHMEIVALHIFITSLHLKCCTTELFIKSRLIAYCISVLKDYKET